MGQVGVVGLEGPADEGREAAGLVLQLPQPVQMLDPFRQRLDVAEHHGGRADAAQFVPDAHHVQPVVGQRFAAGDRPADAVDQDLRPAAGDAAQPGGLQPLEHGPQRQLVDLREVVDFRRAEAVHVDLREAALDVVQQLLVPVQLELRVQAALQQDLLAAHVDRLLRSSAAAASRGST